jgi:hypothetical protein
MGGAAILKIEVYQRSVGNSVFFGLLFKMLDDFRVQPQRSLLLEFPRVSCVMFLVVRYRFSPGPPAGFISFPVELFNSMW